MNSSSLSSKDKTIKDFSELIETIARIEYARLGKFTHLIEYADLVNIGSMAVHVLLSKKKEFNKTYLSTAIKWSIRNELRQRYKWYSNKQYAKEFINSDLNKENKQEIREAVYETILSVEGLEENDVPTQIKDSKNNPEEKLVFKELNRHIKDSMKKIPEREQLILTKRFFEGKKVKELADEMNITSSRVSRIIQTALDRIKKDLESKDILNLKN